MPKPLLYVGKANIIWRFYYLEAIALKTKVVVHLMVSGNTFFHKLLDVKYLKLL